MPSPPLSRRAYSVLSSATQWQEVWEAADYYDRVSRSLETARRYAIFVGWQIDSRLPMPGPSLQDPAKTPNIVKPLSHQETLKEKILRLCDTRPDFNAYFLIWDHAYFYVLEREAWQTRIWEGLHPRLHFIFDNRHPYGASHHEKLCIIDGEVALCGGIDLCDERWDTPLHPYSDPRRSLDGIRETHGPYHDLGLELRGPVCRDIQNHVAPRWRALSGIPFPVPPEPPARERSGVFPVYLSRTLPGIDPGPAREPLIREVEFLFRDLIRAARRRIILEGQYYWSREINDLLISKMHERRGRPFEILLILAETSDTDSPTRHMIPYQMSLLGRLREAARATGTRLLLATPYVHSPERSHPPKPIYIHSKVLLIDDRFLSIGSANFAARALRLDTELNLTLAGESPFLRARIRRFRRELLAHWNLRGSSQNPLVRLRGLRPALQEPKKLRLERLFDPTLPWLYSGKRRLRVLLRRNDPAIALALLFSLASSAVLSTLLAENLLGLTVSGRHLAYLVPLSLAWLLPIASFPPLLLAAWDWGSETAARLLLASLWSGSLFGYALGRLFPAWTGAALPGIPGPGLRDFGQLLRFLVDPRVGLRAKFAAQGVHCISFPWFALATWLILPALLQLALRLAVEFSPVSVVKSFRSVTAGNGPLLGLILAGASFLPGVLRLLKKSAPEGSHEERAAESPLLQHPQRLQREQQEIHPPDDSRAAQGTAS
ncbi:MAG: phospholipase D-like domain-containing protein [Oligoflexia bacterium]|nr:phospholipase D-like domain-containing protein [Oligoflexia bacterium]